MNRRDVPLRVAVPWLLAVLARAAEPLIVKRGARVVGAQITYPRAE